MTKNFRFVVQIFVFTYQTYILSVTVSGNASSNHWA